MRGEAHFHVTEKPRAALHRQRRRGVAVRAVGTAFDILFGKDQVEIFVTEGQVTVEDLSGDGAPPAVPLLVAGQRAIVVQEGGRPRAVVDSVAALTPRKPSRSWRGRSTWLVFDRTPSRPRAIEAFNAQSSQRIILGDPSLANRRLGGMFRADNLEGFVRLLETGVDVRSERRGENEIVLLPAHQ